MKRSDIVLISLLCLCVGLICGASFGFLKTEPEPIEESTRLETAAGSGSCAFLDIEARSCVAHYEWTLDYPSEEFDRLSIDLIIRHTIQKYFIRHSYTDFSNAFINKTELKSIIEDCVFAIQPIGFKLINLNIQDTKLKLE